MRRTIPRCAVVFAAPAASCGAFYLSLRLKFPDRRVAILALLVSGIVFALVGGVLLGGLLWRCVRRGGKWWAVLVAEAILSGAAFYGLLTAWAGHLPFDNQWAEPLVVSGAILLLAANAHTLGWVLVPGRIAIPAYRKLAVLVLVYGSFLGGFLLDRAYPLPRQAVPPKYPSEFPMDTDCHLSGIQPRWTISTGEKGDVRIETDKHSVCHDTVPFGGEVVSATGPRIDLPGGEVEVEAFVVFTWYRSVAGAEAPDATPGRWYSRTEYAHRRPAVAIGAWRLDGTPIPENLWPKIEGMSTLPYRAFVGVFVVKTDGAILVDPEERHRLVFTPTEMETGCLYRLPSRAEDLSIPDPMGRVPIPMDIRSPIPGPLEFRLRITPPHTVEHYLGNRPGDPVELETNEIALVLLREGRYRIEERWRHPGNALVLLPEQSETDPVCTTAVFLTAWEERTASRLLFQAVSGEGRLIDATSTRLDAQHLLVEFPCAREEVAQIRILESPELTEVRFPVGDIPCFPRENYGITNILDLRVPFRIGWNSELDPVILRLRTDDHGFINKTPLDRANPTVRDLLDHHYPASWGIRDGLIDFQSKPCLRIRLIQALTGKTPSGSDGLDSPGGSVWS